MSPDIIRPGQEVTLSAHGVTKLYGHRGSAGLHALDGVDLSLRRGEILGLVGESGSGKSTLAKILAGSASPSSGDVRCDDKLVAARRSKALRRRIQMVFQDPYSSLNPRMTVRAILSELLRLHRVVPRHDIPSELDRLMGLVGLAAEALDGYPAEFSGGQRQRIAIARALAVRPEVLIADEPVSALDVSVQATILELFESLRARLGLSILFIAHNLSVIQHTVDRIAVMYLGRIVEVAPTATLFANPAHPYTQALIASVPRMSPGHVRETPAIEGEPPSPIDLPHGCRFHPRCGFAQQECLANDPELREIADEHRAACLFAGELRPRTVNLKESP